MAHKHHKCWGASRIGSRASNNAKRILGSTTNVGEPRGLSRELQIMLKGYWATPQMLGNIEDRVESFKQC